MTYLCPFLSYSECPMAHGSCREACTIDPEREAAPEDFSGAAGLRGSVGARSAFEV